MIKAQMCLRVKLGFSGVGSNFCLFYATNDTSGYRETRIQVENPTHKHWAMAAPRNKLKGTH